jgi:predicted acylesterase/phospholipase RssA/CRP-like cAMP-binding protein
LSTIRKRLRRNQLAAVLRQRFARLDREALEFIESLGRWRRIGRGQVLFDQDEPAEGFFLLVTGRLEALVREDGGERVAGEVVQGESVGEMGVLTHHPRSAKVRALRDSELVEFSREAFERMVRRYPEIVRIMAEVLTGRLARSNVSRVAGASLVNVAVVPAGGDDERAFAAADRLARELADSLDRLGPTLLLDSRRVEELLGADVAQTPDDSPYDIRLSAWLHEQARRWRFVILRADPSDTPWTRRCVLSADRVLLAGAAGSDPGLSRIERRLDREWRDAPARSRMLVLSHDEPGPFPENTRAWLAPREGVRHVHVRTGRPEDVDRLARLLAGKAVGLVLSGGGARALAHVGVIRALEEAGVPIDAVGGTSMGGILAAEYALGWPAQAMLRRTTAFLDKLRSPANLSFGLSSVLSGRRLESIYAATCGDRRIEDLWLPFFCTSANLYTAELIVHDRGLLRDALYATGALPGVFPPHMEAGEVLVDGALLNGLPCDLMKELTGGIVAAADIAGFPGGPPRRSAGSRGNAQEAGRRPRPPRMFDVLQHTTMLGSRGRLERLRRDADVYIPCEAGPDHGLLQSRNAERLEAIGFAAGRAAAAQILELLHGPPAAGAAGR